MDEKSNRPKKFIIITWGCQMNEHDSEIMCAELEDNGYIKTDNLQDADIVVLNTCSVRKNVDHKVIGFLGTLKHYKKKKPNLIIALGGCMAQNPEIVEFIKKSIPYVNVVFGTRNFYRLPELIEIAEKTESQVINTSTEDEELPGILPARHTSPFKAYVTIMYGCNNFCSYCIVPYTRGREKSRPLSEIYEEVKVLVENGYLEVMLLGQNVNSYGKDLSEDVNFSKLLQKLDEIPGLARIRFMTSHPRDFTDELLETIANSRKVCEHFHLPLQAGSNKVLDKMNRGYSREEYLLLTEKIKNTIPEASITTDIIVGFPGETYEDFKQTLDIVKRVRYDTAYTFVYSPREGTPAAKFADTVSQEEKKRWLTELINIQNRISFEKNKILEGQEWEVLVEGKSKKDPKRWSGRTRTNKVVVFKSDADLIGKIVDVKIECAQTWNLFGKLSKIRNKNESLPLPRNNNIN